MFVLYGWFYSLVEDADNSVNAFRVWRERYPKEESAIAEVEAEVVPLTKRFKGVSESPWVPWEYFMGS